jgi:hypothetical protein
MEKRRFQIVRNNAPVADFIISASRIVGAEQNLIILNGEDIPVAIINLQLGFDRKEIPVVAGVWPNE